jgi:hypothetical protein
MTDLENVICEVASMISEKEISDKRNNVQGLLEELTSQNGMAKLIMIAWDRQ